MKMNPEIFREYDIRGVVGKDFDADFAYLLGKAYVAYLHNKGVTAPKVSLGFDARLSSPELEAALKKGLVESGAHVFTLGLITTPLSYFSTFSMPIDGGIMITGSHNPPDYNGFKISVGKGTIFGEEIQKLKSIIQSESYVKADKLGKSEAFDIFNPYIDKFGKDINLKQKVKAVIDCGNGAAGSVVRRLYTAMGIDCEIIFEEPDGRFPNHHPDPTVEENLVALRKRVLETGAAVGIGFDGDADRIGAIDENGKMLFGDELMVIFARSVLKTHPGTPVIGDVKCSDRLYKDIEKHLGIPVMFKTGHSLIKYKMKELNSKFSGEMSGHVFFADRNFGYDDAIYAGARLIEILSLSGKKITELLADLPKAYATPEIRIDTTEEKKKLIVASLVKQFNNGKYRTNLLDGIRISFDDGFALVRSSNTQPVIVCRFEAESESRLAEIQELVEGAVRRML